MSTLNSRAQHFQNQIECANYYVCTQSSMRTRGRACTVHEQTPPSCLCSFNEYVFHSPNTCNSIEYDIFDLLQHGEFAELPAFRMARWLGGPLQLWHPGNHHTLRTCLSIMQSYYSIMESDCTLLHGSPLGIQVRIQHGDTKNTQQFVLYATRSTRAGARRCADLALPMDLLAFAEVVDICCWFQWKSELFVSLLVRCVEDLLTWGAGQSTVCHAVHSVIRYSGRFPFEKLNLSELVQLEKAFFEVCVSCCSIHFQIY